MTKVVCLHNGHSLPHGEVEVLIQFAINSCAPHVDGGVAVRLSASRHGHWPTGWASYRQKQWAQEKGCRWAISLKPVVQGARELRRPRVCWHSAQAVREHWKGVDAAAVAWDKGHTHLGRWPIYVPATWQESFVHLTAHEFSHTVQQDRWDRTPEERRRRPRQSEIVCEEAALYALNQYRERIV